MVQPNTLLFSETIPIRSMYFQVRPILVLELETNLDSIIIEH